MVILTRRSLRPVHHKCYHDGMIRTTISLPDELLERLRRIAAERRVSIASVVREALEKEAAAYRPKLTSLGIADSGYTDTSVRAGNERPVPRSWR